MKSSRPKIKEKKKASMREKQLARPINKMQHHLQLQLNIRELLCSLLASLDRP
jgi:hypothetical protein